MSSASQRSLRSASIALLALVAVACGKPDNAPPKEPPPPKATVFDPVIANKARAQEKTDRAMEVNKEKLEAAMEKIDEPVPTP